MTMRMLVTISSIGLLTGCGPAMIAAELAALAFNDGKPVMLSMAEETARACNAQGLAADPYVCGNGQALMRQPIISPRADVLY
jgi:hypothetical protein